MEAVRDPGGDRPRGHDEPDHDPGEDAGGARCRAGAVAGGRPVAVAAQPDEGERVPAPPPPPNPQENPHQEAGRGDPGAVAAPAGPAPPVTAGGTDRSV